MRLQTGIVHEERGFMMAALLVSMSVMAVLIGALLPVWATAARHEREAELVFRGEQYARAIALFQRKYANTRPPNLDVLVNERFLRKKYKDPITGDDFELLAVGSVPSAPGSAGGPAGGQSQGGAGTAPRGAGPAQTPPRGTGPAPTTGRGGTPASTLGGPTQTSGGGQASTGIIGVTSKSTEASLRVYNGQRRYRDWNFVALQMTTQAGAGIQTPNGRGGMPPGTPPGLGELSPGRGQGSSTAPRGGGRGVPPPPPSTPQRPGGASPFGR